MKRILICCLCLTLLCSCTALACGAEMKGDELLLIREDTLPEQMWQKTASFPDWKGYTDDTLAMNSMLSFRFSSGQGMLWLRVAEGTESFVLYINGRRVDTSSAAPGIWRVDFSSAAVNGTNTLQVSNILPLGKANAVEAFVPYPVVLEGNGSLEGIRPETLQLISDLISSDVAFGFPSAQLAVVKNGRLVYENAWGHTNSYAPDGTPRTDAPPVTTETMYDLASVTKMFSVNYAIQKLVTDGRLDIRTPLVEILGDDFAADTLDLAYLDAKISPDLETQIAWKRALTVRDLMCHQAGFPASLHFNDPDFDMAKQAKGLPGSNLCYAADRRQTLEAISRMPLYYQPGTATIYSDVDYMVLCFVVEAVTGERLDRYMKESFFEPLGLRHIAYQPLENGFSPDDCAATELNGNTRDHHAFFEGIRTETLQGQVHDERAWHCMEGISGHAGLFSSASDLARLASVMITGGYGPNRFFSRNVIDAFTAPKSFDAGQWGMGWWREGDDQRVWYYGTQSASNTVGHQGWTGTLAMIDESRDLVVVYLTNSINSPILDENHINSFRGGRYTAATLGFVPQVLSIGMDTDGDVTGQLLDLAADMAGESLKLIPADADENHPRVKNAYSKIAVLRKWAEAAGNDGWLAFADSLEAQLQQYR